MRAKTSPKCRIQKGGNQFFKFGVGKKRGGNQNFSKILGVNQSQTHYEAQIVYLAIPTPLKDICHANLQHRDLKRAILETFKAKL